MTKILVVTPEFPKIPLTGACEQDRVNGVLQLKRLGYDVHLLTRCRDEGRIKTAEQFGRDHGIAVQTSLYSSKRERIVRKLFRILVPSWWDGQAFEFRDRKIHEQFIHELDTFKPSIVWFDYTFLWPLYPHAQKRGIPIITRSINFEADHFLEEDASSFLDYGKYLGKLYSERRIAQNSDVVLSINPLEGGQYTQMGAEVYNLPLRGLGVISESRHEIRDKKPLKVVFMGSTYNVSHNKRALEFIVRDIAPHLGDDFQFHITGSKMPDEYKKYFNNNVIYEGFVQDLDSFLDDADIAIVPSLSGGGMQQKIFEPLYRGIPTVTHARGVAGYVFKDRKHVMFAETEEDFVEVLEQLKDKEIRERLSRSSQKLSHELFSQEASDKIVKKIIDSIL